MTTYAPTRNASAESLSRRAWELEHIACNLCQSNASHLLFQNDSHGFGLSTVVCRGCGLVYLNPRPTQNEYRRLYRGLYERLYPSACAPGRMGEIAARKRLEWYRPFLSSGIRMLEIGPGSGAFLNIVGRAVDGVDVRGIEPSPEAAAMCQARGLNVQQGYLRDFPKEFSADRIAAFHVLEHTTDPTEFLVDLRERLAPEGILFLEVPNVLGKWKGLGMIHIAHPYQFSPNTLCALLAKTGFAVIQIAELEEKGFESSIRVIARKIELGSENLRVCPVDDPEKLALIFQEKLSGWRSELFRFRAKRMLLRAVGTSIARRLRRSL